MSWATRLATPNIARSSVPWLGACYGFDAFDFRVGVSASGWLAIRFDSGADFTCADGGGLIGTSTTPTPIAYGRHRPSTCCKKISKVIRGELTNSPFTRR